MQPKYVVFSLMLLSLLNVRPLLAVESNAGGRPLEVHGFLSQGWIKSDRNNFYAHTADGTFQFNEFGINFATELTDRLRTGLQLLSRDLGDIGNNAVEVDWAYGDYRWKDWLGLRAGKMKAPYGFYNETRDVDMLRTSIFLPPSIYNERWRDAYQSSVGYSLYGNLNLHAFGSLNYQFQSGEMNLAPGGGMARAIEDSAEMEMLSSNMHDYANDYVEWNTPLKGLRLGMCTLTFNLDIRFETTTATSWAISQGIPAGTVFAYKMDNARINTLSAEYAAGNLTLALEYMRFRSERVESSEESIEEGQEGYAGSIAYRFTEWFELGAYYAVYYADANDRAGQQSEAAGKPAYKAWQKEWAVTARFDLNDYWTLKLEGHLVNGAALLLFRDNPDGLQENSFLFAMKTTYSF